MDRFRFELRRTWNDEPLRPDELVRVELRLGAAIEVDVEATRHGDPPPSGPPGRRDGLWDFEVVELFLLGRDEQYLELELGPHGHYLALRLAGRRRVVASDLPVEYTVEASGSRWRGRARARLEDLPPELSAANAYAIHGEGAARRHLAWVPVPGPAPDFHRLECFAPLERARVAQRDGGFKTG